MTCTGCVRLREASSLAGILDAAYDVFEDMLSVARAHETSAFAPFGMWEATAADGRNAVLFAPSLPLHCLHETPDPGKEPHVSEGAEALAAGFAALSQLLADRLTEAARSAPDYRDRAACRNAARRARHIHALLTGAGP